MNLRRPWTEQEEQELLNLAAQGFSITRLSARLRRTQSAIEGRIAVLRARARNQGGETECFPEMRS